jgi:hypothetical protein
MWVKVAIVVGYSYLLLAAGSGLSSLLSDSSDAVPEAYRTGAQEATDYINARNYGPGDDAQQFCADVYRSGVVGMFQQTDEYRRDYAAGCEGVWSDWQD